MEKENYLQAVRGEFPVDVVEALGRIAVPTLVVWARRTSVRRPRRTGRSRRLFPAQVRVVPDAAHLANLDNPDGFHAVVDPFLTGEAARG